MSFDGGFAKRKSQPCTFAAMRRAFSFDLAVFLEDTLALFRGYATSAVRNFDDNALCI